MVLKLRDLVLEEQSDSKFEAFGLGGGRLLPSLLLSA